MMHFANPIWLWGLTGLLIPTVIHLLSRKEGKLLKMGSVRHLEETSTTRFKSIKLNEYFLLALRYLLIIVLVLFLSGWQWRVLNENEKWLLIENGLENDREFASLVDSLKRNDFRIKLLTTGFPDWEDYHGTTKKVNYWNLLEELKAKPVDEAVVLAYNYAEGFKGKRQPLPQQVQWVVKNPLQKEFVLRAIQISNDSAVLRRGESNPRKTSFHSENVSLNSLQADLHPSDSVSIEQPSTISISIFFDSTFFHDTQIITAAIRAIDAVSADILQVKSFPLLQYSSNLKTDWMIFLGRNIPVPIKHHSIQFKDMNDANRQSFYEIENKEGYQTWILTKRLTEEMVLRENVTLELSKILLNDVKYTQKAAQFDRRVLPEKMSWAKVSQPKPNIAGNYEADTQLYLIAILFLGLFLERWLSYKRRQ